MDELRERHLQVPRPTDRPAATQQLAEASAEAVALDAQSPTGISPEGLAGADH